MSYVLHVWAQPQAQDLKQAVEVTAKPQAGAAPAIEQFVEALRALYPDSNTLEARGKDAEASIWTDSPLTVRTAANVFNLGVRTDCIQPLLLCHIAHIAADHSLHLLDPQAALFYRPDRTVMGRAGVAMPLASRPTEPVRCEPVSQLDGTQAVAALFDRFILEHAAHGWEMASAGTKNRIRKAKRRRGEIDQSLELSVVERDGELSIYAYFGFAHESICTFLSKHAPHQAAQLQLRRSWAPEVYADYAGHFHALFPSDLDGGSTEERTKVGASQIATVRTERELLDVQASFSRWFALQGQLALDRAQNLPAVSNFLDTPRHRHWMRLRQTLPLPWFSLLAILYQGGRPAISEGWAVARRRAEESQTDLQNWQDLIKLCACIEGKPSTQGP